MKNAARLVKRMDCFTVRTVLGKTILRRREDARLYKVEPPLRNGGAGYVDYVVVTVYRRDASLVVGVYPSDARGVASHIGLLYEGRGLDAVGLGNHPHAKALARIGIEYDPDALTEAVVDEIAKEPR